MARMIAPARALPIVHAFLAGQVLTRTEETIAVRYTLQEFARAHPGRSVEIRIPPAGAIQAIAGPVHTRGTPANVVETDAHTWLQLALGQESFHAARTRGLVHCSGSRADLEEFLPVMSLKRP
ncbi:MAG: sterol carrier family protein [Bowdeniella nasicola]|nr:sterol carrier family protein [Bowdeniella nasicola]